MEGNYKRESTNITAETGSSSDIKITAKGPISRYIRYGSSLLVCNLNYKIEYLVNIITIV